MMPYPVKAIANFFINKAKAEQDTSLDLLKLLKLIYLAHGWNLALQDKPLLNEKIEAWEYGPVVPEIYHTFKYRGLKPIDEIAIDSEADDAGRIKINAYNVEFDENTRALLDRVWEAYRPNTGIQLSNWSHRPEGAWHRVWYSEKGYKTRRNIIPNQYMKEYFNTLRKSGYEED